MLMMVLAAPVVLACIQVMGAMYTDFMVPSQDAPPTTTSGESSYAVPDTTGVNQDYYFYAYAVKYWNSCFANAVQEISMYDKLQKLYQDFETMIVWFPHFWGFCNVVMTQLVNAVFLRFFGRARLELFLTKLFLRLTKIFLRLFEQMLYLLWG